MERKHLISDHLLSTLACINAFISLPLPQTGDIILKWSDVHLWGTFNQSFYIDYFYLLIFPWICISLEIK